MSEGEGGRVGCCVFLMFSLWFLSSRSHFLEMHSFSCVFGKNVLSLSFALLILFIVSFTLDVLFVLPNLPTLQEICLF